MITRRRRCADRDQQRPWRDVGTCCHGSNGQCRSTRRAGPRCRVRTMRRTSPRRVAAARALGVDRRAIAQGLRTYPGLPHRMERVAERDGVLFVNDSKATNPDSHRAGARRLSAHPLDRRRAAPRRDDLGPCEAAARPCPRRLYDRRGRADVRASCSTARCRSSECEMLDDGGERRRPPRRSRARSSCSRRPARRSTSSGIMRRGARRSATAVEALA